MKVLFIESKRKYFNIEIPKTEIAKLPKEILLAYSVQYRNIANSLKKYLESNNILVKEFKQVLGCTKIKSNLPILLVGSGRFHAINLYSQAPKVFLLENNSIIEVPKKDIDAIRMKSKTSLIKFLSAEKIGILVSLKPGQNNINIAHNIKEKLEKKKKQAFIFLSNNIDISQLQNYNIDSWINTACSGLSWDSPEIINYTEVKEKNLL